MLKRDLSHLVDTNSGKTGRESLIELGVYDIASQKVNKNQLKKALVFIHEKGNKELRFQKLKEHLI